MRKQLGLLMMFAASIHLASLWLTCHRDTKILFMGSQLRSLSKLWREKAGDQ